MIYKGEEVVWYQELGRGNTCRKGCRLVGRGSVFAGIKKIAPKILCQSLGAARLCSIILQEMVLSTELFFCFWIWQSFS